MPQVTNRGLMRDMGNSPTGKGTVYNAMLKITAASRDRVAKVNDSESQRLKKITKILDKNCRTAEVAHSRVIDKMKKRLREIEAFREVLTDDYRIDKFRTLRTGFVSGESRISARRLAVETMFYHSGFCMKSMRPEIERKLRVTDPDRRRRRFKRRLLECSRKETNALTTLDRTTSVMLQTVRELHENRKTFLPPI